MYLPKKEVQNMKMTIPYNITGKQRKQLAEVATPAETDNDKYACIICPTIRC
jgi:hypothetical protein